MLQNGSFESGGTTLSPWIFRHDVSATLSVETIDVVDGARAAKVTVAATSTSAFFVQLRQEGVHLAAGTAYTVTFWAKASAPRLINARLQSPVAPFPTFTARNFTVTPEWARFVFTYTSPIDVANAFVGFNLAQTAGIVWLDGVSLHPSNLVANSGFETGGATLSPWVWRNDIGATRARDTTVKFAGAASAKVTVPTAGSAPARAQLQTSIAAVVGNQPYRVDFEIMASKPRRANVRVQSSTAPYPTASERTFDVTTAWAHLSFVWTPSIDVADPFLGFNLASPIGTTTASAK